MIKGYIEHVAIKVTDLEWFLDFFTTALGFEERKREEKEGQISQTWLNGGLQLIRQKTGLQHEGTLAHLGIMTDHYSEVVTAMNNLGIYAMPKGDKWFELPEGLILEVMACQPGKVTEIMMIDPRGVN